ncbi:hypothetical protein ACLOJK_011085 [Asimina triloba]
MHAYLEKRGMDRRDGLREPTMFYNQVATPDSYRNMNKDVSGPSGQRILPESVYAAWCGPHAEKLANNVSVQTGEEFSVEFLQDRPILRKVPSRLDFNGPDSRGELNYNQNVNPRHEDHKGIPVQTGEEFSIEFLQDRPILRKVTSRLDFNGSDSRGGLNYNQNANLSCEDCKGNPVQTGVEFSMEFLQDRSILRKVPSRLDFNGPDSRGGLNYNQHVDPGYEGKSIPGHRRTESDCTSNGRRHVMGIIENDFPDKLSIVHEAGDSAPINSNDEMHHRQVAPGQITQSVGFHSGKMKFLCSFGGRILPRPSDGKLRYVGGETRIITIRKNVTLCELMQKTFGICNQAHTIKYQLPGEDLDALISVSSDEDLLNMMEEYHGLECIEGSHRLRLFLISANESENCSFDSRAGQNNSEYHYVVAINGILDPSPRKSIVGQGFTGPMEHNFERSRSFHPGSSSSLLPINVQDGNIPYNVAGMFPHHAAQYLVAAPNASKSPTHSPPFSPTSMQQRDSQFTLHQSNEDQFYHFGNESATFPTNQLLINSYVLDSSYHQHGAMARHHPHMDSDQPVKPHMACFHSRTPSRDLNHSPAFVRCESDLQTYTFCEKHSLDRRTFHSEKFPRQEDFLLQLAGPDDSKNSHVGIPHAFSDSQLVENDAKPAYVFQEAASTSNISAAVLPSPMYQFILKEGFGEVLSGAEENDSKHHAQLPNAVSSCFQARQDPLSSVQSPELPNGSESVAHWDHKTDEEQYANEKADEKKVRSQNHHNESGLKNETQMVDEKDCFVQQDAEHCNNRIKRDGMDYQFYLSPQAPKASDSMILTTLSATSEVNPDSHKAPSQSFQVDESTCEYPITKQRPVSDQPYGLAKDPFKHDQDGRSSISMAYTPPFSVSQESSEVVKPDRICGLKAQEQPFDFTSSSSDLPLPFIHHASDASPNLPSVPSQNLADNQETRVENSVCLPTVVAGNDAGRSLNFHANGVASCSVFQNPVTGQDHRDMACSLDQYHVNFPPLKAEGIGEGLSTPLEGKDKMLDDIEPNKNFYDRVLLDSNVIVEDVTDDVPSGIRSSSSIVPHVVFETVEEGDVMSPKVTDTESLTPESECEDSKDDDRDIDNTINDAVMAEMEAGIYGLQVFLQYSIIRNADLEELRELGSGTFGTVYHGKWRGTDVAIKRIKKSCFAGRSSEQERLVHIVGFLFTMNALGAYQIRDKQPVA